VKRTKTTGGFLVLFAALLALFLPSFSNPPRSDWWALLYHFHSYRELPALERALAVVNYDVCAHGTYRPLFHVPLYWMHLVFGADYFWFHAANFGFYCLGILLLYRLGRALGAGRGITLAGLAIFAFLYSHFDIVTWTFHIGLVAGFCLLLLGFLAYLSYLRTGRLVSLLGATAAFLAGMLCYETFIPWPPAIFILLFLNKETRPIPRFQAALRGTAIALTVLYALYAGILSFTQGHAPVKGLSGTPLDFLSPSSLSYSLAVTASGLVINGIVSNLDPLLFSPGIIRDNINRGGVLLQTSPALREALARQRHRKAPSLTEPPLSISKGADLDTLWWETEAGINRALGFTGCLLILLGIAGAALLRKRRCPRRPLPFIFALYLLLSGTFALYHGRMATNLPVYVLLEFRYQYVPNALLALLGILGADRLFKAARRLRPWVYALLGIVLTLNLLVLNAHLQEVNRQMAPLGTLISNIKAGMANGRVDPKNGLYLDDSLPESLPQLCWNVNLAPYMRGTYQWLFPSEQLGCFTFSPGEAAWTVATSDFSLQPLSTNCPNSN